jgi:hypothetical protein
MFTSGGWGRVVLGDVIRWIRITVGLGNVNGMDVRATLLNGDNG